MQTRISYPGSAYPAGRPPFFAMHYIARIFREGAIAQFRLKPIAVVMLVKIVTDEDRNWYQRPASLFNMDLARDLGCSEDTVQRTRDELVKAGLLHYERHGGRRSGTYWVEVPPQWEDSPGPHKGDLNIRQAAWLRKQLRWEPRGEVRGEVRRQLRTSLSLRRTYSNHPQSRSLTRGRWWWNDCERPESSWRPRLRMTLSETASLRSWLSPASTGFCSRTTARPMAQASCCIASGALMRLGCLLIRVGLRRTHRLRYASHGSKRPNVLPRLAGKRTRMPPRRSPARRS